MQLWQLIHLPQLFVMVQTLQQPQNPNLFEVTFVPETLFPPSPSHLPNERGISQTQATAMRLNFNPYPNTTFLLCCITTSNVVSLEKICTHAFKVIWVKGAVRMQDHFHFTWICFCFPCSPWIVTDWCHGAKMNYSIQALAWVQLGPR